MVRSNGIWEPYAIEINLRKGGTTHPFLTLQFLTDGTYDPESAIFTAPNGQQKFFVASDHVESPAYRTLTPDDLFDIVVRHNLHFDQTRQIGVVFHMMSALGELGRTGLTAVGNSREDAKATYERAVAVLNEETRGEQQGDADDGKGGHGGDLRRARVVPATASLPARNTSVAGRRHSRAERFRKEMEGRALRALGLMRAFIEHSLGVVELRPP